MAYRNIYSKKTRHYFSILLFLITLAGCQNPKKNTVSAENSTTDSLLQQATEYKKTKINYEKSDTLFKTSQPFIINGIKCFWEFTLVIPEGASNGQGLAKLKNCSTNKIILSNSDIYNLELYNSLDKINFDFNGEFKDANFDRLQDFVVYSWEGSGSGGAFYNVYLFDKSSKTFKLSKELSGGEFEINTANKTVTTYWKMGIGWNSSQVRHFGKNGKIKFTEITTREVIARDSNSLLKTTYEKVANGKIIKTEIDTAKFEGY